MRAGLEGASPRPRQPRDELAARMAGIGMRLATVADADADIERTLIDASVAGLEGGDLRTLSILTTWIDVHVAYVNADRLVRLLAGDGRARVRAYWSAISTWKAGDRRLARLRAEPCPVVELLPAGTAFQVARRGEDPRFSGTCLQVPAGTLRDRAADVATPEDLCRTHRGYRNRVQMGPTWRADVWTVLEASPELSVAEVARRCGCAFASAWVVARDFRRWSARGRAEIPGTAVPGSATERCR